MAFVVEKGFPKLKRSRLVRLLMAGSVDTKQKIINMITKRKLKNYKCRKLDKLYSSDKSVRISRHASRLATPQQYTTKQQAHKLTLCSQQKEREYINCLCKCFALSALTFMPYSTCHAARDPEALPDQ